MLAYLSDLLVHVYICMCMAYRASAVVQSFSPPSRLGLPWSVPGGSEGSEVGPGTGRHSLYPMSITELSAKKYVLKLLR